MFYAATYLALGTLLMLFFHSYHKATSPPVRPLWWVWGAAIWPIVGLTFLVQLFLLVARIAIWGAPDD
jgi:hypothetical protein